MSNEDTNSDFTSIKIDEGLVQQIKTAMGNEDAPIMIVSVSNNKAIKIGTSEHEFNEHSHEAEEGTPRLFGYTTQRGCFYLGGKCYNCDIPPPDLTK